MFYIEDQGTITNYQVTMNKEELERIRKQIIYQCSIVEKRYMNDSLDADETDTRHNITNIKKKLVDRPDHMCTYYSYDYDHYEPPKVVATIDALLKQKYDQLIALERVEDIQLASTDLKEKITAILGEYDHTPRIQFIERLTREANKLMEQVTREESRQPIQKSVKEVVPQIEQCFQFEPGITIPAEEFYRTIEFLQETDKEMTLLKVTPPVIKSEYVVQMVKRRMKNGQDTRNGK